MEFPPMFSQLLDSEDSGEDNEDDFSLDLLANETEKDDEDNIVPPAQSWPSSSISGDA